MSVTCAQHTSVIGNSKCYVRKQKKRSVNFELGNETEKDVLRRFVESDSP